MRGRDATPVASQLLAITGFLALVPANGGIRTAAAASAALVLWSLAERRTSLRLPKSIARASDLLIVTAILALAAAFFAYRTTSLVWLMNVLVGSRATDLGPFRAITRAGLDRLDMQDRDYGWTVEMQIKAALQGLRVVEVPVDYRPRIGRSKVSGTLGGSVRAGVKIIGTILRGALGVRRGPAEAP